MHKLGLKLYSTNDQYVAEASSLYAEGLYDFIELLPVPGSYGATAARWKSLGIPYIVHAPHFSFGVNLGLRSALEKNREILGETFRFADELGARSVICHPGIESDINETARQMRALGDPRLLVENKPYRTVDGKMRCIGGTVEEIAMMMREARVGFCMDICHAASYAVNLGRDPYGALEEFAALGPAMFHLSDGIIGSGLDTHDHIGEGDYDWGRILPLIPDGARVTIETKKDSQRSLSDFRTDVLKYRELFARHAGLKPRVVVRRAAEGDMRAVFELSNEASVRRHSIRQEPIPWENHVGWFNSRLKDPDCDFFVAESGGAFAAQVRYHREADSVVVSISVAGPFRGKGLAPAILKESARQVFAARPWLQAITAYISPDNPASVNSFARAGYRADGASVIDRRTFNRYVLERSVVCG